jgi:fatty acid desaturase
MPGLPATLEMCAGAVRERGVRRGTTFAYRQGMSGNAVTSALRNAGCLGTSLPHSIAVAVGDLGLIGAAIGCGVLSWRALPFWAACLAQPILLAVVARSLRGLECLVHEAAHYNWSRSKAQNDLWANLLAAWPTSSTVEAYRAQHSEHHRHFDTARDPDRARLGTLRAAIDLAHPLATLLVVARYAHGFSTSAGSHLYRALAWHLVVFVLPLALLFGPALGAAAWLGYVVLPWVALLPVLRLVGELEEHDYEGGGAVLDATFQNVGFLHGLLVHPHRDGFHVVHHLFPNVPQQHLVRAHALLVVHSHPYARRHRVRRRVMGPARAG